MHHKYGISVAESQTFLRAKRPQQQRAWRNRCFCRLTPPPPQNSQFSPWRGYGYFLEPHNEETINLHETGFTRYRFFTSYLIDVEFSLGYLLFLFLNCFSMRVSDNQKNVCCHRLCVCINTGKFKGLAREITSSSEVKKVINMAHPFNHRRK